MTRRVLIFDYGAGNLHSLRKAVAHTGALVSVADSIATQVHGVDTLLLPGVGAFSTAAARLRDEDRGAIAAALSDGLQLVGICLGMQLLFDSSEEGPGAGLGLLPGTVTRLDARRVPQIGWNAIDEPGTPALAQLPFAYYANSFACRPRDPECVLAWSTHEEDRFPAAVRARDGRILGVQFHPEKSSRAGLRFLSSILSGEVGPCS